MNEIVLPVADVKKVLESNQYKDEVRKNERRAFMIGMPSAPLFVINNKYSITGAQPYEVFLEALKKVKNTTKEDSSKSEDNFWFAFFVPPALFVNRKTVILYKF